MKTEFFETYDDKEEENSSGLLGASFTVSDDIKVKFDALMFQLSKLFVVTGTTPINHLESILDDIELTKSRLIPEQDGERLKVINEFSRDTMLTVLDSFKKFMNIPEESNIFGNIEDLVETEGREFIIALYEFFVIYRLENITNFVYNVINRNFKDIAASFKESINRKDISTKSERKKMKSSEHALVIDRIEEITHDVLNGNLEIGDSSSALETITAGLEDNWHNSVVSDELDSTNIPSLLEVYIGDLRNSKDDHEAFSILVMQVRSKLVEKFVAKVK
jgi:hypothetical protein